MKEDIFVILCCIYLFCAVIWIDNKNNGIKEETKSLQTQIIELQNQVNLLKTSNYHRVIVTGYHPQSRGINSDKNPNTTATMKKPVAGYTLALSSELVSQGWLGQSIYIEGWGVGKATDRMNTEVKGKRIDICMGTLKQAKEFGIKENVLAIVLD